MRLSGGTIVNVRVLPGDTFLNVFSLAFEWEGSSDWPSSFRLGILHTYGPVSPSARLSLAVGSTQVLDYKGVIDGGL